MELIGLVAVAYVIYLMVSYSTDNTEIYKEVVEKIGYFTTTVIKERKRKDGLSIYTVKAKGLIPNKYSMNLVGALYLYDESDLTFISNYSETSESESSRVFRRNIDFGYVQSGSYYEDWRELTNTFLEGVVHPYKGKRKISFEVYLFDPGRPINFKNGLVVSGAENAVHMSKSEKIITFEEPGYMDEIKNADKTKPLMVEIAMGMAMSDGSLDKKEGEVLKNWIKQEVNLADSGRKTAVKNMLNDALESSYKKLKKGQKISSSLEKFNEIASKSLKYQVIELCLEVLSADGVAEGAELEMLRDLSDEIGLSFDEVSKMKDKALVKIDSNAASQGQNASDEAIVGLSASFSKEESLKFINKEFKKWNGRLNSLDSGNERDNAQLMLDALARLRKKYEAL
ncbi:MAG: hypothetical protein CMD89_05250 [Gammaproteobacteria bacterium]|nr:hypothetical protein [Gammaproteobacteria bacterium]|tara:strand:- start:2834 stop:4027 length:1194 start_codon:yes stop_codon:yes gene_type:complete